MGGYARANYAYEATSKTELSLKKGDVVHIIDKYQNGWWVGEINGNTGLFPGSYVTEIEDQSKTTRE